MQGYEPFALKELVRQGYGTEDVVDVTCRCETSSLLCRHLHSRGESPGCSIMLLPPLDLGPLTRSFRRAGKCNKRIVVWSDGLYAKMELCDS